MSRIRNNPELPANITEAALLEKFNFTNQINAGDQEWRLLLRPVHLMAYARYQQIYPVISLLAGWLFTLFITLYVNTFLKNSARIHALVEEKTVALQQSQERFNKLQESEQRYRSVTESARDGIVTIDEEGCILAWNRGAETIFGYQAEEMVGDFLFKLIPEEMYQAHCLGLKRFSQQQDNSSFTMQTEKQVQRKDGSWVPLEISGATWMAGEQHYFTAIIRDVSSWKKLMEELQQAKETAEQANKAKSVFLATMSHEIRTPMNGILGMAELLLLSSLTAEQEEQVRVIAESGENLISIINNILDFSKIEAGRLELEVVDFNLPHLLNNLARLFGELARKKQLSFDARFAPDLPPWLRGDPHRLNQILINLLGNAVKFTDAGGVVLDVSQSCGTGQDGLILLVKDSGPGIAEEQLEFLFQPFTQADNSTTRRFGGTGLGLSITKKLTEHMGGTIHVSSRLGQGSLFQVWLPMVLGESQVEVTKPRSVAHFNQARILLVEDDRLNQAVLRGMFRQFGIEVTLASDGQMALDWLNAETFDMVFMDCHMPVMDGLTACRAWRAQEWNRGEVNPVPVVALTALAMSSDRETCLQAGMSDFLSKPTSLEQLEAVLRRWLQCV